MKKSQFFLRMMFLSAVLSSMISCGLIEQLTDGLEDDDDYDFVNPGNDSALRDFLPDQLLSGSLEDAPFEEYAVKFIVNDDKEIASIELMASGTYLVLPHNEANITRASQKPAAFSLRLDKTATRSDEYDGNGKFGEFTVEADGRFHLNGFGYIKFNGAYELEIVEYNKAARRVNTQVYRPSQGDNLDKRFGRTWHPISAVDLSGHVYTQEELNSEFVKYVIVSRSCEHGDFVGTFSRVDTDNSPAGNGFWGWYNKTMQMFKFVYDDEDFNNYGVEQVYFEDEYAYFLEGNVVIKCVPYGR